MTALVAALGMLPLAPGKGQNGERNSTAISGRDSRGLGTFGKRNQRRSVDASLIPRQNEHMRILLVEDDARIAAPVNKGLSEEGCSVTHVADGHAALQRACAETFDVIVLDILLPRRDGWSVLHELRKRGNRTPVLMLTALNSVDDRVHGLNDGADDYLTKPFAFAELLARIRALSRRGHDAQLQPLRIADITLEPVARKVLRGDRALALSPREYELLEYFLRNAGRTLSRTELAEHVWGYHHECGTNVIDVYVNYLRRKIDRGRRNKLLRTVRGVGYVLSENADRDE